MTGFDDRLSRSHLLYGEVIAGYLDTGFVERQWLAGRIERHLRDPTCRFVLLSGGPGTGKSAFLAWLTRRHDVSPRYFLRRHSCHPLASGDARSLLLSIGHQLAVLRPAIMRTDLAVEVSQNVGRVAGTGRVVGVRVGTMRVSPFQHTAVQVQQSVDLVEGSVVGLEIDRMVADPRLYDLGNLQNLALLEPALRLAAQEPDTLMVVIVDAIDEIRHQWSAAGGRDDLLEWLARCPELPRNLRIVVSSRPDRELLRRFRLAQADRLREENIEPTAGEVRGDLLAYARGLLADPVFAGRSASWGPHGANVARRVAEHAGGSFLYLVLWGKALREAAEAGDEARVAALTDLSVLPAGLDGIYEYFLVLISDTVRHREGVRWKRVWNRVYRRLFGVLAVAQAPLTRATLLLLSDLADERDAVADAVTDLAQFLADGVPGIQLCHVSVAEFLVTAPTADDWHVDAAENHLEVARRSIAEYGRSWESCTDEYALTYTVTHLVAATAVAGTRADRGRAAERLTELLADPAFGVAKGLLVGVDAMLGDYVAAHTALQPGNGIADRPSGLATGLAEVMARLVDRGVPYLADTLHAVAGYRPGAADLNEDVLGLLSDPDFLARFVPDEVRRASALVAFSHGQATRLRRTGDSANLVQARGILLRAVSAAEDSGHDLPPRQKSSVLYDLGYLDFLYGDHERARQWFDRSTELAALAGDRVGTYISRLVNQRVGLLSGAVAPETFVATHEEALAFFTGDEADGPHVARWVMSARLHLVDLALLTENAEPAAAGLRALEDDPWIRGNGRTDIVTKYRARVATILGEWETACTLFDELLQDELVDPPSHREELARDLYYYGRALAARGDITGARQVWELGLRCPDDAANWPWKPRIDAALQALPDEPSS